MYSTCLHCHASLGANEVVEHFAIGRRLAFDASKGRLWVVCDKCRRWNLTPLEERWEAIEECEREFSRTRMRVSSDNIALARTPEGLELVRVGAPKLPEFAAWRYGSSLHKRWKTRAIPWTLAGSSVYGMQFLVQANLIGFGVALFGMPALVGALAYAEYRRSKVRMRLPDGRLVTMQHSRKDELRIIPHEQHGWALSLTTKADRAIATGTVATHGLRGALTAANFFGGRRSEVSEATRLLASGGDPARFIGRVAAAAEANNAKHMGYLPPEVRLALEMALQEDAERALLEGELQELQKEWELAEEVARIADDMFLPDGLRRSLARLKLIPGRP